MIRLKFRQPGMNYTDFFSHKRITFQIGDTQTLTEAK